MGTHRDRRTDRVRRGAMLWVSLLVLVSLLPSLTQATTTTTFADGSDRVELAVDPDDGGVAATGLRLPFDAHLQAASVRIVATQTPGGSDPTALPTSAHLTVGSSELALFGGTGMGAPGRQFVLADGSAQSGLLLQGTDDSFPPLLLPVGATVLQAQLRLDVKGDQIDLAGGGLLPPVAQGGRYGYAIAVVGDVTGDGGSDFVVTEPEADTAWLYTDWWGIDADSDPGIAKPIPIMIQGPGGTYFGWDVSGAGDLNGDLVDDLVITCAGAAFVYFGGQVFDTTPDLVLTGDFAMFSLYGISVAGGEDLNGDGWPDVVVGDMHNDVGDDSGKAYLYFGGPGMDGVYDLRLSTGVDFDGFGLSLSVGGDLNGDGAPDLAVGAPPLFVGTGTARVYYGGAQVGAFPNLTLQGAAADDGFGSAVLLDGDVTGDGIDDLLVGAPTGGAGSVGLFLGGAAQVDGRGADSTLVGGQVAEGFGNALAISEDVTHDKVADVAIGAPYRDVVIDGVVNDDVGAVVLGAFENLQGRRVSISNGARPQGWLGYDLAYHPIVPGAGPNDDAVKAGAARMLAAEPGTSGDDGAMRSLAFRYGAGPLGFSLGTASGPSPLWSSESNLNGTIVAPLDLQTLDDAVASGQTGATPTTDEAGRPWRALRMEVSGTAGSSVQLMELNISYEADLLRVDLLPSLVAAQAAAAVPDAWTQWGDPSSLQLDVPLTIRAQGAGTLSLQQLALGFTPNSAPTVDLPELALPLTEPLVLVQDEPQEALLTATVADVDESSTDALQVSWWSDRDGLVEQGPSLTAATQAALTVGTHQLTVAAVDPSGRWSDPVQLPVRVEAPYAAPQLLLSSALPLQPLSGPLMLQGSVVLDPRLTQQLEGGELHLGVLQSQRAGSWNDAALDLPPAWSFVVDPALHGEVSGQVQLQVQADDGHHRSEVLKLQLPFDLRPLDLRWDLPSTLVTDVPQPHLAVNLTITNLGPALPQSDLQISSEQLGLSGSVATVPALGAGMVHTLAVDLPLHLAPGLLSVLPHTEEVELWVVDPLQAPPPQDLPPWSGALLHGTTRLTIQPPPVGGPNPGGAPEAVLSVRLELPPGARPGQTLHGSVTVTHVSGPHAVGLELALSSPPGFGVVLADPTVPLTDLNLQPGQALSLPLLVEVPENARIGRTYAFGATLTNHAGREIATSSDSVALRAAPPTAPVRTPSMGWWVLLAPLGVGALVVGMVAGTEWGRFRFIFAVLVPLYTRVRKEEVLDNFTRGEINGFIKQNPGTYYREIQRALGLSNGVLTYHLAMLEKQGYVLARNSGRYKHYFPAAMIPPTRVVRLTTFQRLLLRTVRDAPGINQQQLVRALDVPQPTVSRHLTKLSNSDLLRVEEQGGRKRYFLQDFRYVGGTTPEGHSLASPILADQQNLGP